MIKVFDNFFEKNIFNDILIYCYTTSYKFNEKDYGDLPVIGGVSNISLDDNLSKFLDKSLKNKIKEIENLNCFRIYINCFSPGDKPYFHTDNQSGEAKFTCLIYINENFKIDDGGETQFIVNDEIKGILPIPNRLVVFDAGLMHKATSFRDKHRFTIAVKYY